MAPPFFSIPRIMAFEGSSTTSGFSPAPSGGTEPVLLPASFAQELLWLIHRSAPDSTAYNVPRLRRLRGPLDAGSLQRALDALVARHEILRTTYASHADHVVQSIHAPRSVPFEIVDLTKTPALDRDAAAERIARE